MKRVNNIPRDAEKYIVARPDCEGGEEFWYYGSWDDVTDASKAAVEVGGRVFDRDEI